MLLPLVAVLLLPASARAGDADALWAALHQCAGFTGNHKEYRILEVSDLSIGGIATSSEDVHVAVVSSTAEVLIAHELAHNWAPNGPPFLVEGHADWLAACALQQIGSPPRLDTGGAVGDIPNLRSWEPLNQEDPRTNNAYLASWRFVRLIEAELGVSSLRGERVTWATLSTALNESSPEARLATLAFDVGDQEAQAAVVDDEDGDGLIAVEERRLGTRPDLADTDGDGFADGVNAPAGSLPLDRPSVCLPQAWGTAEVELTVGGTPFDIIRLRAEDLVEAHRGVPVALSPWAGPLRIGDHTTPARAWVLPSGPVTSSVPCVELATTTVWSKELPSEELRSFAEAFDGAARRLASMPPRRRTASLISR